MEKWIKHILLVVIIGILFAPLFQYYTHFTKVKELHGSFVKLNHINFSLNKWFDNEFQESYDNYYNENFGFRNLFVRVNNQLDYSFFNKSHANGVAVGKDDYLYEKGYILSYQGKNYIGRDSIEYKINRLEEIYDTLQQYKTELLVVIAPGKGFFYPEYIPDSLVFPRDTSNYEIYIETLKKSKIPFIDFNSLFLKMKDTTSIIIYPKTGIHWSQGIIPYVADSIVRKIEALTQKDLANISWTKSSNNSKADKQDADIEKALNLIFPIQVPPMNYPNIHFENKEGKVNLKAIAIADSFWWQIFNMGISKNVFDDAKFWYYYKQIYPDTYESPSFVENIDVFSALQKTDIVILICTEANLDKFPFGFENGIHPLNQMSDSVFQQKLEEIKNRIRNDETWFNSIQVKAEKKGISVDSMLFLDAKYILKSKNNK